jgi:nicotinamidase-related amidase
MNYIVGVDIGGTFTDCVAVDDAGSITIGKALSTPPLDLALRARNIDTLIVSGGSTDVGVLATLLSARDHDYHTIVARDACGTSHDQRAHDTLMDMIFPRMSRVRTTDQVIEMLRQGKSR